MLKKKKDKGVVTDSSGKQTLGVHTSKEKALEQIAAVEASKARAAKTKKGKK